MHTGLKTLYEKGKTMEEFLKKSNVAIKTVTS